MSFFSDFIMKVKYNPAVITGPRVTTATTSIVIPKHLLKNLLQCIKNYTEIPYDPKIKMITIEGPFQLKKTATTMCRVMHSITIYE
jgi:hypothetical protein